MMRLTWNASGNTSGMYYLEYKTGGNVFGKRMMMIR
jgi:hypothetical protein